MTTLLGFGLVLLLVSGLLIMAPREPKARTRMAHNRSRTRKKSPLDEVYDNERLDMWERHTVVWPTPHGTEYLIGPHGGVLFVPHDLDETVPQ